MKRVLVFCFLFVLAAATPISALATDGEIEAVEMEKATSFTVIPKFDFYKSSGKPWLTEQGIFIYGHHQFGDKVGEIGKKGIGFGIDQWYGAGKPQSNHGIIRPFITGNIGPYYAITGISADTRGARHAFVGLWYVKEFHKFNIFLDWKYFASLNNKKDSDFLDLFFSVTHPLGKRFFVGIEGEYIPSFGKKLGNDWSFVGPAFGININKNTKFTVRLAESWTRIDNKPTVAAFYPRAWFTFNF